MADTPRSPTSKIETLALRFVAVMGNSDWNSSVLIFGGTLCAVSMLPIV
jgi:hypothetical protein